MTKIITYNVNGIRAATNRGLMEWLRDNDFDIVALQEIKADKDQAPLSLIEELGYHHYWHPAEKKGYSGVATFSKKEPDKIVVGCGMEKYDREGRILRTDFGAVTLLNCYFPSGTTGDLRQDFKYEFLDDFYNWVSELKKERPNLIIVGDYNIAHTEMDIHNPKSNKNSSGFLPEERAWMTKWLASGFTDAFRHANPDLIQYSWWSFRANARTNNKGWRIDYQNVSNPLKNRIKQSYHIYEAMHSDHCPVFMEIEL